MALSSDLWEAQPSGGCGGPFCRDIFLYKGPFVAPSPSRRSVALHSVLMHLMTAAAAHPSRRDATQRAYAPCNCRHRALAAYTDKMSVTPLYQLLLAAALHAPAVHLRRSSGSSPFSSWVPDGSHPWRPRPDYPVTSQVPAPPLAHAVQ